MAASVQVLCPNGRRQNVKITPNTKLLQVLEEVCKRQGFIPPEDYTLMHGRNQVDLSLSMRFAGLSNNAKLELIKSLVSRQEQDVMIALQLHTGKRLQGTFAPSLTLWDILLHFEDKNSECKGQLIMAPNGQEVLQPVCIFMQEQVVGESALKATTLKKLGLTSGRAIIRLLHRPVEKDIMASICKKVEKDKAKEIRLEEIAGKKQMESRKISESEVKETVSSNRVSSMDDMTSSEPTLTITDDKSSGQSQQESQRGTCATVSEMEISTQNPESDSAQEPMEEDTVTSAQSKPGPVPNPNASERDVTSTVSSQRAEQSSAINDLRNLNIPGLEIFTPDDFNDLTPQEQALAQRLTRRFLPHLQAVTIPTAPSVDSSSQSSHQMPAPGSNFANFKFPEETKGKDLNTGLFGSSKAGNSKPCERQPAVYRTHDGSDTSKDSQAQELPPDFFEVTQADVRTMYRDLQKAVQDLEEQPLMTSTMREIKTQAICDKYEQVVIRVHFPDKLVLQAFFRPMEPVKALHTFVRNSLQDKKVKFYLYTTPPRRVLEDMNSALVSQTHPEITSYGGQDSYLESQLREQIMSRLEAESVVAKMRHYDVEKMESTSSASESQPGPSGMQRRAGNSSRTSSSSSGAASSGIPKWLKLGKK